MAPKEGGEARCVGNIDARSGYGEGSESELSQQADVERLERNPRNGRRHRPGEVRHACHEELQQLGGRAYDTRCGARSHNAPPGQAGGSSSREGWVDKPTDFAAKSS